MASDHGDDPPDPSGASDENDWKHGKGRDLVASERPVRPGDPLGHESPVRCGGRLSCGAGTSSSLCGFPEKWSCPEAGRHDPRNWPGSRCSSTDDLRVRCPVKKCCWHGGSCGSVPDPGGSHVKASGADAVLPVRCRNPGADLR